MQYINLILIGLVIGIANIIPGVSGGTMAVVFNVFDELIGAISNFKKDIRGSLKVLVPILFGAAVGILAFAKLITFCLEFYPVPTNYFFVGLIAGSLPLVFRKSQARKMNMSKVISFAVGLGAMLIMVFVSPSEGSGALITALTPVTFVIMVLCGAIAAIAMIIPGISGSFIMLLMGVYSSVTGAIAAALDAAGLLLSGDMAGFLALLPRISLLIPIALGVLIGLIGGAKLINWLLSRHEQATYSCIMGLVIGSILVIFPGFIGGMQALVSIAAVIGGCALALVFSPKEKH